MKMRLPTLAIGLLALILALPIAATPVIRFNPAAQSVNAGSTVTVDLVVSGLTDNAAPSLGTFDLNVNFDRSILTFNGAIFGSQLDLFGLGDIRFATLGVGTVNLFELSLESAADLDNLQAGAFILAILSFTATGIGTSGLDVSLNALGDSLGNPVTADIVSGSIASIGASVPEPSTLALVGLALFALLGRFCTGGARGAPFLRQEQEASPAHRETNEPQGCQM